MFNFFPLALLVGVVFLLLILSWITGSLADGLNWLISRFRRRSAVGIEGLQGAIAVVRQPFKLDDTTCEPTGTVFLHGELWTATCSPELALDLAVGDRVQVERVDGLTARILKKATAAL